MKKIVLLACTCALVSTSSLRSQSVGINTTSPHLSSQLDITSTNKGLLIPRIAFANRPASPATCLLIYQTDNTPGFYYYNGTSWILLLSEKAGWSVTGNAGTDPLLNFIGTTDNKPLLFKANNQKAGLIDFDINQG